MNYLHAGDHSKVIYIYIYIYIYVYMASNTLITQPIESTLHLVGVNRDI
jgi:hypothetical protein